KDKMCIFTMLKHFIKIVQAVIKIELQDEEERKSSMESLKFLDNVIEFLQLTAAGSTLVLLVKT
ncbi:hypothetical protein Tco_1008559, partial [Tanacetum coccineum]